MVPEAEIRVVKIKVLTMKKLLLFFVTVAMMAGGFAASAQGKYGADSANCIKYLSYYREYFKQKSYDDALPHWRKAYQLCPPTANHTMLIDGTFLMRKLIIKNAKNPILKKNLVDTLMTLHDTRAKYYPKYSVVALNNKGLDMSNFIKDDPAALYKGYGEIIEANGSQTKPQLFLFELNSAIELYRNGTLNAEDVINAYQRNISLLEQAECKTAFETEQNEKIRKDIESLFISSKVAGCEDLIALFTPRFESNPNDIELVTNIVKMMSLAEDCTDNDLYLNAVTSWYKLEPTHTSAYFLYKLNSSRGNAEEAIKYLEEAIAFESSDAALDIEYTNELAAYCYKNGKTIKAYELAKQVAEAESPFKGKAYMLMGTIWGSTNCSGNEIERRAPYWVAVDCLQKAKAADETLAEDANRMIATFTKYFPETGEAFMYGLTKGQSYTVSCGGLRAVTTVRTQN